MTTRPAVLTPAYRPTVLDRALSVRIAIDWEWAIYVAISPPRLPCASGASATAPCTTTKASTRSGHGACCRAPTTTARFSTARFTTTPRPSSSSSSAPTTTPRASPQPSRLRPCRPPAAHAQAPHAARHRFGHGLHRLLPDHRLLQPLLPRRHLPRVLHAAHGRWHVALPRWGRNRWLFVTAAGWSAPCLPKEGAFITVGLFLLSLDPISPPSSPPKLSPPAA